MNKIADNTGSGFKDQSNLAQKGLVRNSRLNSYSSDRKMATGFAYQQINPLHPKDERAQF